MDLNDMRKKFREKKAQEEVSSTSPNVEENAHAAQFEEDKNSTPTKSGDSSTVSLSEISYYYEKGANKVSFSCSRLDNTCDETTGLLSLCCWISEKTLENGNWQNDNYAFVDCADLGYLEKGYGFPDINHTFNIPDNLVKVINDMNNDKDEWHFVFTVNELDEDGNNYIIFTINGQNENEGTDKDADIFKIVKAIVVEKLGVDPSQVVENASFMNDLGADSLDAVELVMEFEKAFDINIPDEIAETIYTVGDAVKILEENI